jgi:autotransporter-associated beta strand protein
MLSLFQPNQKTNMNKLIVPLVALVAISPCAQAQTLYWDADATANATLGGTGNWDAGTSNWSTDVGNTSLQAWAPGGSAVFQGTAGTVTINSSNVTASGLTFATAGYILARSGSNTLILGSAGVTIPATSGTSRFSTAVIAGIDGLTVTSTPNSPHLLQLQGANTFTGPINLNGGKTQFNLVSGSANLGNSSNLVTVGAGAQFFANVAGTIANNLVLNNSTGVYSGDTLGTIRGAGGLILNGSLTLQSAARIGAAGSATTGITINGKITGSGDLEIGKTANGSGLGGIVVFSNPANDFTGNLTISAGASSRGTLKLAASEVIPNGTGTGNLTLNAGSAAAANLATLDLAGFDETINGLISSSGKPENNLVTNTGGSDSLLTVGSNNATGSFSGLISDGPTNELAITKIGTGTLTLNAANTYTGDTTVSGGTLALNGNTTSAIALGEGTVLALALANQVVSTNTLSFAGTATVSVTGTPEAATTYNLITATDITGTPALTPPINGFSLVNTGTVLQLAPVVPTGAPEITSPATASGLVGTSFSYQIFATNAPQSFAITAGTLPDGLTLNTTTGLISGTPTSATPGGGTAVTLSAGNSFGSNTFELVFTFDSIPPNIFTGPGSDLDAPAAWSYDAAPNSSASLGSFTDVQLDSIATALTTASDPLFVKSLNVTNGSSYTMSSVLTPGATAFTRFRLGNTGTTDTVGFFNAVSGAANDLVYLANGSNLTISPSNPNSATPSQVELRNSGNLNISAGSTLSIPAVITGAFGLTKTGEGTAILGAANTYSGTTTVAAGTLTLNDPLARGTGQLALLGGTVSLGVDAALSQTTSGGFTLLLNGASTIDVAAGKTGTIGRIGSTVPSVDNVVTKTGLGTLQIIGGGSHTTVLGGYKANEGMIVFNTSNATAGSGPLVLDGGHALFAKSPSSTGAYNPYDLIFGVDVRQNATLISDPNPATPSGFNYLSFTSLTAGSSTLQIVKGPNALSSADTPGYTDPEVIFLSGTLNGALTLDVGLNTAANLQAAVGPGGVTKTGPGLLVLADNVTGVDPDPVIITPSSYTGPTTVSEGTLSVTGSLGASAVSVNAGTLSGNGSFGGNVTIAAGATHSLAVAASPAAQDTSAITGTLAMAGSILNLTSAVLPASGEYVLATATDGITGTPASINYNGITGTVTVDTVSTPKRLLLTVTGGSSPYDAWAALNALEGINALAETDVEKDGLSNLLEFVLGGNPNSNDTPSVLPKILDGPSAITISFKRSNDSKLQPVTVKVQVSANLGTWNPADDILIGDANGTGPNGASYTVMPNGSFDDIVVTIPKNSANVKFARVQAVIP